MIIEQIKKEPVFVPIKIVLETAEEAAAMWHIFNCSADRNLREYSNRRGLEMPIEGQKSKAWMMLDALTGTFFGEMLL